MTTGTHTPGKWRAVFRGVDQSVNWASRIPFAIERVVGNAVQPIADVCDQPEAEANASLIAAAPDLLLALKKLQAHVFLKASAMDDVTVALLQESRAAIAKATGSAQ